MGRRRKELSIYEMTIEEVKRYSAQKMKSFDERYPDGTVFKLKIPWIGFEQKTIGVVYTQRVSDRYSVKQFVLENGYRTTWSQELEDSIESLGQILSDEETRAFCSSSEENPWGKKRKIQT